MRKSIIYLKTGLALTFIFLLSVFLSCSAVDEKPNVILIMADDMGYECLGSYGSLSYNTPVLDSLAAGGIRFSNCISQPLCTPSRVKIMTGMYNYRNYDYFGHLNNNEYTFGNLMREAGYATCIAGKWQLNGLAYKKELSYWNDNTRPQHFGFDEYCLWQLTKTRAEGERFANPLLEQNGIVLGDLEDKYGPDIFTEYILDFIERNSDQPFFVYYPMVLVHEPFVPTPDSQEWDDPVKRFEKDTTYFKDMVEYVDKIVAKISNKIKSLGIDKNTILIFTGDNGTDIHIRTRTTNGFVQGGKGNTTNAGTHVPLIIYWPEMIQKGYVFDDLIEFSDFFPTLADMVDKKVQCDGKSLYPLLTNSEYNPRSTAFVHYDPRWGARVNQYRNQFVRTIDYKLYQDGKFYNLEQDKLEQSSLHTDSLNSNEREMHSKLEKELNRHPAW